MIKGAKSAISRPGITDFAPLIVLALLRASSGENRPGEHYFPGVVATTGGLGDADRAAEAPSAGAVSRGRHGMDLDGPES